MTRHVAGTVRAGHAMTSQVPLPDPTSEPHNQRIRALLGEEASAMTDAEVAAVGRHADLMARAIVDAYLQTRGSKAA